MAKKTFNCRLITPEAQVLNQAAVAAVISAWDGSMGILSHRAPIVAKLGIGELRLDLIDAGNGDGSTRTFLVEEGFAHMVNNELTILASKATPAKDLSEAEAQAEAAAADARRTDTTDPGTRERLRRDRERAHTRLRVVRSLRARSLAS